MQCFLRNIYEGVSNYIQFQEFIEDLHGRRIHFKIYIEEKENILGY